MDKKLIPFVIIALVVVVLVLFVIINKEAGLEEEVVERTERQLAHPELLIEDIEPGEGENVKSGDTVVVHYVGILADGSVFDSSYDRGRTFSFTVGKGRVISGWEIGIENMQEGGKRRLTIPPELGYGESGVRGMIPPNATIIFEIEVVEILKLAI